MPTYSICNFVVSISLPPDGVFLYMSAQIAFKELYICTEIPTWTEIVHKYTNYLKRNCIWKGTVPEKELYQKRNCNRKGTVPGKELYLEMNKGTVTGKELYLERNCTSKGTVPVKELYQ